MHPRVPDREHLAACFYEAQHPITYAWADRATRLRLLAAQRADDVMLATDLDVATLRAQRFAPTHAPEDLLNRWVEVGHGQHAMMSMRYEDGNVSKPFVDATVLSRPLEEGDLAGLAARSRDTFGGLDPRYLRLWSSAPARHFSGTGTDRRFLAAPLEVLRRDEAELPAELRLVRAESLAEYDEAVAAYQSLDAKHPDHADQAALQDREDLAASVEAGLLFDVTVDGVWAGYSGALTDGETLGLPAYVVQEIILTEASRGHGYGPHLTTLLARALPADNDLTTLLGTIHADNRGAIGAALKAGRVDVGGWLQLPL